MLRRIPILPQRGILVAHALGLALLWGAGLLALALVLTGCTVDRRTVLMPPTDAPAWSLPTISPSGDVLCWPLRTPFDNCIRTL